MSAPHYPLFIDGEWVDSSERYEIRSPATDELVATVAKGDVGHVDRAVAAAKAAHESGVWRDTPPEAARRSAERCRRSPRRRGSRSSPRCRRGRTASTIRVTGALHIGLSIAQLQYLAELAKTYEFEKPGPAIGPIPAEGIVRREPLGVVAAIVPWNIPLLVIVWKIAPALAAGNTVVLKPDEHAPLLALEVAKEFEAAGLPRGRAQRRPRRRRAGRCPPERAPRRAQGRLHRVDRRRQEHPRASPPTRSSGSPSSSAARAPT